MSDDEPDTEDFDLPPEVTKLTDPNAQKLSRDRMKREEQEAESFWRAVFADKTGRREMWRLLNGDCHGFSPPFACGPNGFPQTEATWFQAGQYSIGQRLYQRWMRLCRDGVQAMHDENDPLFARQKAKRRDF